MREDPAVDLSKELMPPRVPTTLTEPASATTTPGEGLFAELYTRHASAIYYLALRLMGNAAMAEDATHDVFLKAFRSLHTFRGGSNPRTWLYRIALNHCNSLRATWYQRTMVSTAADEIAQVAVSGQRGPGRELEGKELSEAISDTLQSIPPEQREVLLLAADGSLSYEEIATLTGQTPDGVRGRLHRARKAFIQKFPRKD